MKKRNLLKKILSVTGLLVLFVGGMGYSEVHANATDTLTFKIGYFGWPTSEYIEKKVYSASDIKSLSSGELLAYTYYDGSGHRIAIDSARGATLDSLLNNAGIDKGSISSLAFYTTDSGNGAFATFTMQELILTDRYYFPNLAENIGRDGQYIDGDAKRNLWNEASKVGVVLAYEDKWVWYPAETEGAEPSSTGLNTQNRFRLCFGQSNPLDYRTYQSAKMVETIYVMFSGSPSIGAEETNISGKVGSTHSVKITASVADDAFESKVLNDVTYSSSDESIASVDANGNITFHAKGDAVITAKSGDSTVDISVHVGKEDKEKDKEKGKENGSGKGKGNGSGKGSSDSGNGSSDGKGKTKSDSDTVKESDDTAYMYVLSEDAGNQLKNALAKQAPAEQASMSTYQEEMSNDAEQLQVKEEENRLIGTMALVNGIIVVEGGIFGFLRYRKQRWG